MDIGSLIVRFRWLTIAGWLGLAVAMTLLVSPADPAAQDQSSFLPDDASYNRAIAAMKESFPNNSGLSAAVVVFDRVDSPLSAADYAAIEAVAAQISHPSELASQGDLEGVQVRSPRSVMLGASPFVSEDKHAALVVADIPANFITLRSDRIVDHIHSILSQRQLPTGLNVAITGSSGFGHDYADAAEKSHQKTLWVTLVAVIVILMGVYRAPVAAMVPLVAISLAAYVAMLVLVIAQHLGMHVGTAEKIFVVVLLYGAGTDYSLFFISRFREYLEDNESALQASADALDKTLPAILASAGTDMAGLLMLCFAGYGVFRSTGPAVAIALVVAMLAAITLVPALVAISGRKMFWPEKLIPQRVSRIFQIGRRKFWPNLARLVTARPAAVGLVVAILLAVPAWQGANLTWVYDTLTGVEPNDGEPVGNAAVGVASVKQHWPVGQIAPAQVLICSPKPADRQAWQKLAVVLSERLTRLPGVRVVRSLTRPLGREMGDFAAAVVNVAGWSKIKAEYLSEDMRAMRLAVVLDSPGFSLAAMNSVGGIRRSVEAVLSESDFSGELHIAGATAEMIDTQLVTQADFQRVAILSLTVIFLIILALMRDVMLTAFMVGLTVLSYFAALGISYWVFTGLLGQEGLDWKVQVFLFVVMVAVGVDYNIFLAARLAQEAKRLPTKLATCRAIIHTGPVISSCGLIMAATLGSLMAGDLQLLKQLGFAMALGMLIDSFLARPLLLPAFVVLTGRTGRAVNLGH